MGTARQKLNVVYVYASLLVAALFGLTAGSWAVFWVALAVTIGCGVHGGEIRPRAGKRCPGSSPARVSTSLEVGGAGR